MSGRDILLNGKRFFIKGVDYGPTNAGYAYYTTDGKLVNDAPVANPLDSAYKKIWQTDLDLMRADGVNAIKVYNVSLDNFKSVPGYNSATFQHPSKGFAEGGDTNRFTTTTFVDGTTTNASGDLVEEAPYFGTKFKSTNDTWGLDIYRGPHLAPTHFWEQVREATTKPMLLGEYGNPAAWFYESTAKHGPQGHCIDYPEGDPGTPEDVDELLDKPLHYGKSEGYL